MPFTLEICAAAVDPKYRRVIIVTASQSAKTECLLNIVGQRLDDDPAPILMVYPSQRLATSVSKSRLMPMIRSTPTLAQKLDTRKTANSLTEKYVGGQRLGLAWAGSATELSSHPAALIIIDELDRMGLNVEGEGDPVTLAEQRSTTFAGAKIIIASTPTLEGGSPIWSLYEQGTQHVWTMPCPECSAYFAPCFELLKWPEKSSPTQAKRTARLACPTCGALIEDKHRNAMNAAGRFEARGDLESDTASFWVSGLASPWRSWGDAAKAWVEAYRSREPGRLQAVTNTVFGELWRLEGEAPPASKVAELRGGYAFDEVPAQVRVLTAGVDVQGDRLVYVVRGWGEAQTSWLIRHGELWGDTLLEEVWTQLAQLLQAQFGGHHVRMTMVDSGYRPDMVYSFARRFGGGVLPSKGHESGQKPVYLAKLDINVRGEPSRRGVKLSHIDTGFFKSWIHGRIAWPLDQPGAWHLPIDATEDYCEQIVAEQRVTKGNGQIKWIRTKTANHYLDAEVLATAAAHVLQVHLLKPAPANNPVDLPPTPPAAQPQRSPFGQGFRPPASNWVTGWRR